MKAVKAERMLLVVIVMLPEVALSIVILNGADFHLATPDSPPAERRPVRPVIISR